MNVKSIERRPNNYFDITFVNDGEEVHKFVRIDEPEINGQRFSRAAREADRDFAYRKHGARFREHCTYKDDFWSLISEAEFNRLLGK